MHPETLKEYLVKIGWNLDESGFKDATKKINSIKDTLIKTKGIKDGFKVASEVVFSALKTVNEAILDVVESTALLDYETEKQARLWWVSEEQARSYQTALNAIGETHEDFATMTNEQYKRLYELNQLGRTLEDPSGLEDFLLLVRDVNFEFSKFKVELEYGKRWVSYYLGQFLGPDVVKVRDFLKSANTWIQKNISVIAEKVARFFEAFYMLGKAAFVVAKDLFTIVKDIFTFMFTKVPQLSALIAGFVLLFKTGPLGRFLTLLSAILLIIEDYLGWKEGKASFIDWSKFEGTFEKFGEAFEDIKKDLSDIFVTINDIVKQVDLSVVGDAAIWILKAAVQGVSDILDGMNTTLQIITGNFDALGSSADSFYSKFKGVASLIAGVIGFAAGGPAGAAAGVLAVQAGDSLGNWLADKLGMSSDPLWVSPSDSDVYLPSNKQFDGTKSIDNSITYNMNGMTWTFGSEQEAMDWFEETFTRRDYTGIGK